MGVTQAGKVKKQWSCLDMVTAENSKEDPAEDYD